MRPVLPANLLGLPAAVVPAGLADGLPVGAQLTGGRFADLAVLDAAQVVEDALGDDHPDRSRDLAADVTARLVAIDLPGGPAFVDALQRTWDDGDAAFPVDRRLPEPARRRLLAAMAPAAIVSIAGTVALAGGRPVEPGDALVVATSGSTGDAEGRRPDPRRRGRVGAGQHRPVGGRPRRSLAGLPAAGPHRRPVRGDPGAASPARA